jgi:diguanylate cyclase (GGDEF)-like protein
MTESTPTLTQDKILAEAAAHRADNRYPSALLSNPIIGATILNDQETIHVCEHDKLTGLENRHSWELSLHKQLEQYLRLINSSSPNKNLFFVLTMMDCDNFDLINKHYGHLGGDVVLQKQAQRLQELFRKTDGVGRFGGDEFIQFGIATASNQEEITKEFQEKHKQLTATPLTISSQDHQLIVPFSQTWGQVILNPESMKKISQSLSLPHTDTQHTELLAEKLLYIADNSLYEAKQAGKNQVKTNLIY